MQQQAKYSVLVSFVTWQNIFSYIYWIVSCVFDNYLPSVWVCVSFVFEFGNLQFYFTLDLTTLQHQSFSIRHAKTQNIVRVWCVSDWHYLPRLSSKGCFHFHLLDRTIESNQWKIHVKRKDKKQPPFNLK